MRIIGGRDPIGPRSGRDPKGKTSARDADHPRRLPAYRIEMMSPYSPSSSS